MHIPNRKDIARQYAEARKYRADSIREGWLNTAYCLCDYIRSLRAQWAYYWRNP